MTLSEELLWRGMIKDKTFDDVKWLDTPRKFYLGSDCQSSDSLTIGNLAVYMLARTLAKRGWKAVLLVGGATSLIGDPGGKDEERSLKSKDEIDHNVGGIKAQVERLFTGEPFDLVNNYDWFKDIGYLEFLRDVGKHYSMTELVQRDFIATRMNAGGSGISYAEFSYNLIQGYDYWWLFKNKGVELQIGGSDQWGNMLSGAPLVRKKEGKEVHALSMPLTINKATGKKFGKSEAGAVWLDPAKTSTTQFYQFWINVDDEGVEDYLKIYTELSKKEIDGLVAEFNADRSTRKAQKALAYEVTKLVHGEAAADEARARAETLKKPLTLEIRVSDEVRVGDSIAVTLVKTKLAQSNSDARRLLKEQAVYINEEQISRELFEAADFIDGRLRLRKGKRLENSVVIELKN
jgi:tyrosyl-tRNA synthetase